MKKKIAVLSLIAIFIASTSISAQVSTAKVCKEKAKTEACCKDKKVESKACCKGMKAEGKACSKDAKTESCTKDNKACTKTCTKKAEVKK